VVGNERTGITQHWYGHASGELTIPMHGRADSLNVAVSASILMYDICARREDQRAGLRLPAVSGAARAGP
jgi:tRNA G18 (ribose-2'-O)-methylase SpoU